MKDWDEIFKKLAVEFDARYLKDLAKDIEESQKESQKEGKNTSSEYKARPYAPIWLYRKRLKDVLGVGGYQIFVTDPKIHQAQAHQRKGNFTFYILTVEVTLQLLEDDRTVAFQTKHPGITEVVGPTALQLNLGKASSAGLKDCCEEFGIGGDIEWIWKKSHSTQQAPAATSSAREAQRTEWQRSQQPQQDKKVETKSNTSVFKVKPNGAIAEGRNGSYYVPVKTNDGRELTLWFYKDRYEALMQEPSKCTAYDRSCVNRFDDLRKVWAKSKQELTIDAQINEERGWLYFHNLAGSK